jgi:hypothetical protein
LDLGVHAGRRLTSKRQEIEHAEHGETRKAKNEDRRSGKSRDTDRHLLFSFLRVFSVFSVVQSFDLQMFDLLSFLKFWSFSSDA